MKLRQVEAGKTPAWQFKAEVEGPVIVIQLWCDGFPICANAVVINQPIVTYSAEVERTRAYLLRTTNAPDDTQ